MEQRQQAFTQQHQHKYTNGQKPHAKHQIQHDDTLYVCVYSLMFSIPIRKDLAKFSLSLWMNEWIHFVSVKLNSIQNWWWAADNATSIKRSTAIAFNFLANNVRTHTNTCEICFGSIYYSSTLRWCKPASVFYMHSTNETDALAHKSFEEYNTVMTASKSVLIGRRTNWVMHLDRKILSSWASYTSTLFCR